MNNPLSLLPREVSALVHHVELNRAGWWDRALNRLVLAAVWLAGKNPDEMQICSIMQETFDLTVGKVKLASVIKSLKAEDSLVEVSSGVYRIPDKARKEFDLEVAEAERVETKAREYFCSLVAQSCPDLNATDVWKAFESKFLVPMIHEIGANTYKLIIGEAQTLDETHTVGFLTAFGQMYQSSLKAVVTNFLDPKMANVRQYITRMLHAHFCVEASGVSEAVLERLKVKTDKPPRFRLFVDTNFLFSLIGLHENPSNASARELKDLLATLRSNPRVDLYITPRTITEAKRAIGAAKIQVSGVPQSDNFTEAALRVGLPGMSERFFAERQERKGQLTANDWFDPYIKDFVPLARAAGVELYNEDYDAYGTRQDVVDDIHLTMDYEKNKFPEDRQKSYEIVAHDVILWHVVKDKRPAYVESPMDAQEWILTVDFRLIGFDQHKMKTSGCNIPLCLHPTTLIQLLQFWIPRTQKFEEAVLGGMRFPFLFQEFDAKAERLSLAIINKLGRFEGSEEIPEDTLVGVILNDGLRARIEKGTPEEAEIELVRDALVEEMRLRAETEKARAEELKVAMKEKNLALAKSKKERDEKDQEINKLQKRLGEEEEKLHNANEILTRLTKDTSQLKSKVEQMNKEKLRNKALRIYLVLLILVIGISLVVGWQVDRALTYLNNTLGSATVQVALGLSTFLIAHLLIELFLKRNQPIRQLWPFKQMKRFRKWLWFLALALLIGVASSLIAGKIQKYNKLQPLIEQSNQSGLLNGSGSPTNAGSKPICHRSG